MSAESREPSGLGRAKRAESAAKKLPYQENGWLVAERNAAQKALEKAEDAIHQLEAKSEAFYVAQEAAIRENQELRNELNALHSHNESEAESHEKLSKEHRSLTEALTKLEAELSVKNKLIDRLLAPHKHDSGRPRPSS